MHHGRLRRVVASIASGVAATDLPARSRPTPQPAHIETGSPWADLVRGEAVTHLSPSIAYATHYEICAALLGAAAKGRRST